MTTSPLSVLVAMTYSRADLAYRIGLLKEFLEFVFFTSHGTKVTKETLALFEERGHVIADIEFLRSLPVLFFDPFTEESFYAELDRLTQEFQKLPVVTLTVPVVLDLESREMLGMWIRKVLSEEVLLDISIDAGIATGCQVVWKNQLHDFGFDYFLSAAETEVRKYISERVISSAP